MFFRRYFDVTRFRSEHFRTFFDVRRLRCEHCRQFLDVRRLRSEHFRVFFHVGGLRSEHLRTFFDVRRLRSKHFRAFDVWRLCSEDFRGFSRRPVAKFFDPQSLSAQFLNRLDARRGTLKRPHLAGRSVAQTFRRSEAPKLRCTEVLALKPEAASQIKAKAEDVRSAPAQDRRAKGKDARAKDQEP